MKLFRNLLIGLGLMISSMSFGQMFNHYSAPSYSGGGSGGGTPQNLILYSEQLDNAVWNDYPVGDFTVTANQANDVDGNPTMEQITTPFFQAGSYYQTISANINTSTAYVISFEASASAPCELHIIIEDNSDFSVMLDTRYDASLTSSAQRFSYEFTTEASLSSGINVTFWNASSCASDDSYIGRVHLYEGTIGDYDYVTTTSSQVY